MILGLVRNPMEKTQNRYDWEHVTIKSFISIWQSGTFHFHNLEVSLTVCGKFHLPIHTRSGLNLNLKIGNIFKSASLAFRGVTISIFQTFYLENYREFFGINWHVLWAHMYLLSNGVSSKSKREGAPRVVEEQILSGMTQIGSLKVHDISI